MTFEMGGGWSWMRIILVMGFGVGGLSCKTDTHDMFLLYRNLLKHAALSVSMCFCLKLEDDYQRWAMNDLHIVVVYLKKCSLIFTWEGLLESFCGLW